MPSAARVLTLIVSICHTVQAGRLSAMGTHLLRHFARNHGRQNTAAFKHGHNSGNLDKIPLPRRMRFKADEAVSGAPTLSGDNNPYKYAAPNGNGATDLMTPFYGSYSHNYGPVYQLLTPVSGYGGYPGTIDPRGFNAPTQNYTHGVFADDLKAKQPANARILGKNGLPNHVVNALPGVVPTGALLPGYQPLAPGGIRTVVGQLSGTIPLVYPNGRSQGLVNGNVLRPAFAPGVSAVPAVQSAAAGVPGIQGVPGIPLHPLQAATLGGAPGVAPGVTGFVPGVGLGTNPLRSPVPGLALRSPYNPAYSLGMMQHHQVTLNGAANGYGTPGLFHPMSEHYPTPDSDPYGSVLSHPVLPPNYGKEGAGSGSGAKAA